MPDPQTATPDGFATTTAPPGAVFRLEHAGAVKIVDTIDAWARLAEQIAPEELDALLDEAEHPSEWCVRAVRRLAEISLHVFRLPEWDEEQGRGVTSLAAFGVLSEFIAWTESLGPGECPPVDSAPAPTGPAVVEPVRPPSIFMPPVSRETSRWQ